jgi:hypothetical protein
MDARWHGFVHLCARVGAFASRTAAKLGNCRHKREHRFLRRAAVCVVPGRLGTRVSMGTCRGQVRASSHADADDRVVFAVHLLKRVRHPCLAARDSPAAGGHRYRRRVGHGWHVRRRRMAGTSAALRRGLHAHWLLCRSLSCGVGQFCHWQPLRLARDVRGGRTPGIAACVDSPWGDRARVLDAQEGRGALVGNLAAFRGAVFKHLQTANHLEFDLHAGVDLRTLGGDGIRARSGYDPRGIRGAGGVAGGAAGVARGDAGFVCHDPRLLGHALARRAARTARWLFSSA